MENELKDSPTKWVKNELKDGPTKIDGERAEGLPYKN